MTRTNIRLALATLTILLAAAGGAHAQQLQTQGTHLTLKQAVTRALSKSRDLSIARLQVQAAQKDASLSRAQFLPNLYAGSGAAFTSGFPLLAGGGAPALFSLAYDQTIFDLPARGQVRAAQQKAEQQQVIVDGVRDSVIVRVASTYLELAKVRREMELLTGERASAGKILDYTKQRSAAGFELPIEVTKAQLTSAQVEQRIAQLEDQEDTLSSELRDQLGMGPDEPIEVASEDIPASADQASADLVALALRNNVEIKQAESERQATQIRLQGERGGRWPTIGLIGQYNVLGKFNHYDEFFNSFKRNNIIAGVDIRIPVFAAHSSAAVAEAQANLDVSTLVVANKRTQVSLDVRHKAHLLHEADTSREVARLELDLAQQNLQVLQSQFNEGRLSVRDMESAQLAENDKWLAFLDADFARQQAQLDLLQTTGQVAQVFQ